MLTLGIIVSASAGTAVDAQPWSPENLHHYADILQALITAASLIAAGSWAYFRFVLQAERYAHIQTAADLVVIARQGNSWIVEVAAVLENKGRVEHSMSNVEFDLNALHYGDPIETNEKWGGQVDFPRNIARGSFLPKGWRSFFIGPGLTARYSWIAKVPIEASVINVHCTFTYDDRVQSRHTMETTLSLAAVEKAPAVLGKN